MMPASLPLSITSREPMPFSAILATASNTDCCGEIDATSPPLRLSIELTVSVSFMSIQELHASGGGYVAATPGRFMKHRTDPALAQADSRAPPRLPPGEQTGSDSESSPCRQ